jgi:hypothetical protein
MGGYRSRSLLRFWSGRLRVTVEETAVALAASIIESANGLVRKLVDEGFARAEPARFASDAFLIECVLCEWFLRDLVLWGRSPRNAATIRRLVGDRLFMDLLRSGLSPASLDGLDRILEERFTEYAEAWSASESLQPFGARAWMRILGRVEPSERGTMLLAVRGAAELRGLSAPRSGAEDKGAVRA